MTYEGHTRGPGTMASPIQCTLGPKNEKQIQPLSLPSKVSPRPICRALEKATEGSAAPHLPSHQGLPPPKGARPASSSPLPRRRQTTKGPQSNCQMDRSRASLSCIYPKASRRVRTAGTPAGTLAAEPEGWGGAGRLGLGPRLRRVRSGSRGHCARLRRFTRPLLGTRTGCQSGNKDSGLLRQKHDLQALENSDVKTRAFMFLFQ